MIAEGEEPPQDFLDYLRRRTRTSAAVMVRHVFVRHVFSAKEQTTLPRLAESMIKHAVKRLPVPRAGKVVGVVSRADLAAAIGRTPGTLVSLQTARDKER